MQLPDGLRAFRHRDYRLYYCGQLVSVIGTWMQMVGQSWLIVQLTDSPFKLGLVSTLQFLPVLLFALFGGALADRLPKRRTLILTQGVMMVLAFTLSGLVWSGLVQYWHVAVLALLLGLANTLDVPLRISYATDLVGGKEDLGNAIALNSALFNCARLVGPAIAGLMVASFGVALAFFLNGASFLAVLGALTLVRTEGLPRPRAANNLLKDVREGLSYVYRTPVIFFLLAMLFAVGLFVINFGVLITYLAKGVLGAGAEGFGFLMSCLGAGALTGAVLMAFQKRRRTQIGSLVGFGVVLCTMTAAMYFVHVFWLAAAVLFVTGMSQILYTAGTNTALQTMVPDELRGRVGSLYQLMMAGTTPFGALLTGAVIERWGASTGFLVDGGLGLISCLLLIAWWWRSAGGRQEAMQANLAD